MKRRLSFFSALILVGGFLGLGGRLFYLQLIEGSDYEKRAIAQQLRDTPIPPRRGTIYDINMKTLAASATVWTVAINPQNIKEAQRQPFAEGLAAILGMPVDAVLKKTESVTYFEYVKRKIEWPLAEEVRAFAVEHGYTFLTLHEDSKRYYPYGNFAASVLGFCGVDNQGLSGLEYYYDEELTGTAGRVVSAKNALGGDMPFQYEDLFDASDGNSLVLTIDETLQHYLEKYLEAAQIEHNVSGRAAGIAINPKTGAILALAAKTDFDPNDPYTLLDPAAGEVLASVPEADYEKTKKELQNLQWRNKIVSDLYEPGSVFKIVTASSALEQKVVSLTDRFFCPGFKTVDDRTMKCHKAGGHGSQDFLHGFMNSCNPVFIEVGQRLGASNFYTFFKGFGLAEKTGVDLLGEAQSLYYTDKQLGLVELASCSFGQSNKITPLQMITAIAAVINGGNLMQPYIVERVLDADGNIVSSTEPTVKRAVISAETSRVMREVMQENVETGAGKNCYIAGYRIGGKSGTSQKLDSPDPAARIASFVAFAPADDPEILVLILLDEPHSYTSFGSTIAAPVVRQFLAEALPYLGLQPHYTEEEAQKLDILCPDLRGRELSSAKMNLNANGLTYRVVGNGDTVIDQVPESGQRLPRGSKVVLYTEQTAAEMTTVPGLIGMSVAQVNSALVSAGLNLRVDGTVNTQGLFANSQSIAEGTEVEKGTVITVHFVGQLAND